MRLKHDPHPKDDARQAFWRSYIRHALESGDFGLGESLLKAGVVSQMDWPTGFLAKALFQGPFYWISTPVDVFVRLGLSLDEPCCCASPYCPEDTPIATGMKRGHVELAVQLLAHGATLPEGKSAADVVAATELIHHAETYRQYLEQKSIPTCTPYEQR